MIENAKAFSIIIPTKNELLNLKRALPQFKKLEGKFSYEVIVADGKSDDGTIDYARTTANRVEVKVKEARESIGEGRNRGARVAKGDILVFLDAGVVVPDVVYFFEVIRETFDDERVVAATTNVSIDPRVALLSDKIVHGFVNWLVRLVNALGLGAGKGEVQIIRASVFKKLNGYNEKLWAAEDNDLYRRLARVGKIVFLNNLRVYDDPRRYRKLGYVRVITLWILNQVSVLLLGKSFSKEWKRID